MAPTNKTLLGLVVLLVISLLFTYDAYNRKQSESHNLSQVIKEKEAKIDSVKLKNGQVMYEKLRVEMDRDNILESYSDLGDKLHDMGVKNKDLRSALSLAQSTQGSGEGTVDTVTVTVNDTTYIASRINISEPFFNFSATIYDLGRYDYQYSVLDSLTVLNTTQRKNIFSQWEHSVKVVNENPKTIITGVTSITIKEKASRFVVGPSVGYGVTDSGLSWFFGVTATKPIITF